MKLSKYAGTRARGPDPQSRRQRKSPAAGPRVGHPVQVDVTLQVRILFCRSARAAVMHVARPKIGNYSVQLDMHELAGAGGIRRGVRREPPGLLQADADRRGPTLFLAGDWVPRDVVAMPWYAGQQSLSLQELHGLTAGLSRVSNFLAERGYRWHGTTRHQIPAHDLLADTRRQPDIRPRVRLSPDRQTSSWAYLHVGGLSL